MVERDTAPGTGRAAGRAARALLLAAVGFVAVAGSRSRPAAAVPGPDGIRPAPRAGRFLVASRTLTDPNFAEAVVYLLDYGEKGAAGVIVNRRTEVSVATALPDLDGLADRTDRVFEGGPVAPGNLILLLRADQGPEHSSRVAGDTWVVQGMAGLEEVLEEGVPESELRVYAGYAGWAPGQLEAEIAQGAWHVLPASSEWIFSPTPESVWSGLLRIVFQPVA